ADLVVVAVPNAFASPTSSPRGPSAGEMRKSRAAEVSMQPPPSSRCPLHAALKKIRLEQEEDGAPPLPSARSRSSRR
ncbi:unnamed protein product, partial [Urochloa humidicola]